MKPVYLGLMILFFLTACSIPQDPEDTLNNVQKRGFIRVGATEQIPWVIRQGEEAAGIEGALARNFADSLDVTVVWQWGSTDTHMRKLHNYELDLVIGGLVQTSPWSREVALTKPYMILGENDPSQETFKHVMAVPPGENRWLMELESFLLSNPVPTETP